MPLSDDSATKYLPGISDAIRSMLRAKDGSWSTTYGDKAAVETAIRQAYQAGRLDGISEALALPAPGAPVAVEEPSETLEDVWERLGLFEPPTAVPEPISAVLAAVVPVTPMPGDQTFWAVQHTRKALGLSLVEGVEYVKGLSE